MKANEVIQLLLYFGLLIGLTPPIGGFMARVFRGRTDLACPAFSGRSRNGFTGSAACKPTRRCRGSGISGRC